MEVKISLIRQDQLEEHFQEMNKEARAWTDRAARGECGWVCADCCLYDQKGMPDECFHGDERCTKIIQRDKREAMHEGNEPS